MGKRTVHTVELPNGLTFKSEQNVIYHGSFPVRGRMDYEAGGQVIDHWCLSFNSPKASDLLVLEVKDSRPEVLEPLQEKINDGVRMIKAGAEFKIDGRSYKIFDKLEIVIW